MPLHLPKFPTSLLCRSGPACSFPRGCQLCRLWPHPHGHLLHALLFPRRDQRPWSLHQPNRHSSSVGVNHPLIYYLKNTQLRGNFVTEKAMNCDFGVHRWVTQSKPSYSANHHIAMQPWCQVSVTQIWKDQQQQKIKRQNNRSELLVIFTLKQTCFFAIEGVNLTELKVWIQWFVVYNDVEEAAFIVLNHTNNQTRRMNFKVAAVNGHVFFFRSSIS